MDINIVFASDNNFCQHLCVGLCSIMENSLEGDFYNVFILDNDKIQADNKEKILNFEGNYKNLKVNFISIKDINIFYNAPTLEHVSNDMYSRLLIPKIFSNLDKVLYLDCDVVVKGGLRELYATDISDYYLAASCETNLYYNYCIRTLKLESGDFFNSGVLLFNLDKINKENIFDRISNFAEGLSNKNMSLKFPDQDILNYLFSSNFLKLSRAYNFEFSMFSLVHYKRLNMIKDEVMLLKNINNISVIHYAGGKDKPWKYASINSFNKEYFYYLSKTPYSDFVVYKDLKLFFIKILRYVLAGIRLLMPDFVYFFLFNLLKRTNLVYYL